MRIVIVLLLSFFCASCSETRAGGTTFSNQIENQDDQYSVLVLKEKGMSSNLVEKQALEKAASLTIEKGARYFVILKKQEGQVVVSGKNNQPGHNLYYELIQENDFSKENLSSRFPSEKGVMQGIRIEFQIYKKNPGGKAVDACSLTNCAN